MCDLCGVDHPTKEEMEQKNREEFPEVMMLETAFAHVGDLDADAWTSLLHEFSDKVSEEHARNALLHAMRENRMTTQQAVEFFGALMFKWGMAVGVSCAKQYGDRFGSFLPPIKEAADAEWERREREREENVPGVVATPEMLDVLRRMGVDIPESVEEIRIITPNDLPFAKRKSETGEEGEAPGYGLYL